MQNTKMTESVLARSYLKGVTSKSLRIKLKYGKFLEDCTKKEIIHHYGR